MDIAQFERNLSSFIKCNFKSSHFLSWIAELTIEHLILHNNLSKFHFTHSCEQWAFISWNWPILSLNKILRWFFLVWTLAVNEMKIISQNEQMGMMHSKPEPAAKLNHLLAKASLYPMNLSATVYMCLYMWIYRQAYSDCWKKWQWQDFITCGHPQGNAFGIGGADLE